jgi:DNA helicase-2/ATP-dependent DNA helicase PcrA
MGNKTMQWSNQQKAIFDFFENGEGNLVVRARAGTGKSTTIIEGINRISPGKHDPNPKILLAAFNKSIAKELQAKINNPYAQAKTLHAMGFGFVRQALGSVAVEGYDTPWDKRRARVLAVQAIGNDMPKNMVTMVSRLMTHGREILPFAKCAEDLIDLAFDFDCVPDEGDEAMGWDVYKVCVHALEAMKLAKKPTKTIDFADMLYLPVVNGWVKPSYDLVCIDECQDMNAVQIELALKACKPSGRIVVIGDEKQAIYGFRGADSGSIDRLKHELAATELGLTTTYRCPRLVVEEAQRLVPDYDFAPNAPDGVISNIMINDIASHVEAGDFVLSRTNAALTKTCMELLRNDVRAKIQGKDLGGKLKTIVKKLVKRDMTMEMGKFLDKLGEWEGKELAKYLKAGREGLAAMVSDQAETMRILSEGIDTPKGLIYRIDDLFGDAATEFGVVICSSVHRAKGLESRRVFVLRDTFYPGRKDKMSTKRLDEERNIEYVALTRAMQELTWVSGSL